MFEWWLADFIIGIQISVTVAEKSCEIIYC